VGGGAQGPVTQNCTSNPNNSRVLKLSRTLLNPCSQKNELNNPAYTYGSGQPYVNQEQQRDATPSHALIMQRSLSFFFHKLALHSTPSQTTSSHRGPFFLHTLVLLTHLSFSHTCPSHTLVLLTHQDGWLPVSLQQEAQPHIAVEMVVHLIPDHDPFPVGRHDLPLGGRLGFLEQLLLCKEQIDELHLHTHTHTHRIMHTHWCYRVKNRLMSSTCTHTHAHTRAHTHIHTQNHVHTYAIVWKKINKLHLHTNTHKHTQIHAHTKMHGKVVCHNHGIREGCSQLTVQPIAQPTTHSSLQLSNRCLRFLVRKLKCQHPYSKLVRLLCFRFSGHEKRMERYGTSSMWPFACGNPAVPPNLVLTHF